MFKFLTAIKRLSGASADRARALRGREEEEQAAAEYARFIALPAASGIRLAMGKLRTECTSSTHVYPFSTDTTLERCILQLMQVEQPPQLTLPVKLVGILLQRLEYACMYFPEAVLNDFLQDSLPTLHLLLMTNPSKFTTLMLTLGLDDHLLLVLQFVRATLLTRTSAGPSSLSSTTQSTIAHREEVPSVKPEEKSLETAPTTTTTASTTTTTVAADVALQPTCARRGVKMWILHDTLRLLLALHVESALKLDHRHSSSLSFFSLWPSCRLCRRGLRRSRRESSPLTAPTTPHLHTFPPSTSSSSMQMMFEVSDTGNASSARQGILTECGHLFLYFSKGALDLHAYAEEGREEEEEEERELATEIICSLAILISSFYHDANEVIIHTSLGGIAIQLARFLVTENPEEPLSLLQQLSYGLLLAAKLLKESPLIILQAMSSVYFFDTLVGVLQVIGREYTSSSSDANYHKIQEESMRELCFLTNLETFRVRKLSEKIFHLSPPHFYKLADNNIVDGFLHCYIYLLETQRSVKGNTEVKKDASVLRVLSEIELTIIKVFLNTSSPSSPFPPSSCLYHTLLKYTIGSISLYNKGEVEKQRVSFIQPLIHAGLYHILFYDKKYVSFQRDPHLYYSCVYILHFMLTLPLMSLEDHVQDEVGIILDTFLLVSNGGEEEEKEEEEREEEEGNEEGNEGGKINKLSLMCALLISAVYGPNTTRVLETILQRNGIVMLATIFYKTNMTKKEMGKLIEKNTIVDNEEEDKEEEEKKRKEKTEDTSTLTTHTHSGSSREVSEWVTYLLTQLLRQAEVQQSVLVNQADIPLLLLTVHSIRRDAEQMVISLLSHRCTESEYTQRMTPFVKNMWALVSQLVKLESDTSFMTLFPIEENDKDHLLLSILFCIRRSIHILATDLPCWGSVRQLQNVLCGNVSHTPDPFISLLHRVVLPWNGDVKSSHGLSCILHTLSMLVRGNPGLRLRLFKTVDAEQLVVCFKNAWFSSHNGSWINFVHLILSLVYEDVDHGGAGLTSAADGGDEGVGEEIEKYRKKIFSMHTRKLTVAAATTTTSPLSVCNSTRVFLPQTQREQQQRKDEEEEANQEEGDDEEENICHRHHACIQNPEILLPLLRLFTQLREFKEKHRDALQYIFSRLLCTIKTSLASLWMISNVGLFEVLISLIPVLSGTSLLEILLLLIMYITSHHITVKETKQFLLYIIHIKKEEEREKIVSLFIDLLNKVSLSFFSQKEDVEITVKKRNYISFREYSGTTGIKAILPEFPQDGYTLSMWLRMEYSVDWRMPQCIFSLQNVEKRNVLELVMTSESICIIFQDLERKTLQFCIKYKIKIKTWTHLTVVHKPSNFPFHNSGSEFVVYINGVKISSLPCIQYPVLSYGYLFLGTREEDVEQKSYRHSFIGQMTSIYFLLRPLSIKEVKDVFYVSRENHKNQHQPQQFLRRELPQQYTSQIVLHIDPRFGENGQLHNLATLLRNKISETSLVTYEGTMICNTNNIIDSICVLGALHTVIIPLFVLLLNPQLPFQQYKRSVITMRKEEEERRKRRGVEGKEKEEKEQEEEGEKDEGEEERRRRRKKEEKEEMIYKSINNLLQLLESLLLNNIVHADIVEIGLFPIISYIIQRCIQDGCIYDDCIHLFHTLLNICTISVFDFNIFKVAYHSFFLSRNLLQMCSQRTQIFFITTQYEMCKQNIQFCKYIHSLHVCQFVINEMMFTYNTVSAHDKHMRRECFLLLDAVLTETISAHDANALYNFLFFFFTKDKEENNDNNSDKEGSAGEILLEVLEYSRILISSKNSLLSSYLSKNKNMFFLLIPLLSDARHRIQNEAFLLFSLLLHHSCKFSELLLFPPSLPYPFSWPAPFSCIDVYKNKNNCLLWLRDKMSCVHKDMKLYFVLRMALTGQFYMKIKNYEELHTRAHKDEEKIIFPQMFSPLLQIMKQCKEKKTKMKILSDILLFISRDLSAWRSIISLSGWYIHILDFYLSEEEEEEEEEDNGEQEEEEGGGKEKQQEEKEEEEEENDSFLSSTSIIIVKILFQALLCESYGVSELELLVVYLMQKHTYLMLNDVLMGLVKEYTSFFSSHYQALGSSHFGFSTQQAAVNFITFLFIIEDVLFYSVSTSPTCGVTRYSDQLRKRGYTEEEELLTFSTAKHRHSVEDSKRVHNKPPKQKEEEEIKEKEIPRTQPFADNNDKIRDGKGMRVRCVYPDGAWLHESLAVCTMYLLTIHSAVLYSGGTNNGNGLDFHARGRRTRKGGFLRLFVRLFRVTCDFTICDADKVGDIVRLADRWVQIIAKEQSSFLLLRRQVVEQREHSPLSGSMIMILSLHDLLTRRLRSSAHLSSFSSSSSLRVVEKLNYEILVRLKYLCMLYRKFFSQMQIFQTEIPLDEASPRTRKDTLDWLCSESGENSVLEFVEVASRQDYDVFIRQCTLIMERDRVTDKNIARTIEEEQTKVREQLYKTVTDLNIARKMMLDVLDEELQKVNTETTETKMLIERFSPQTARALEAITFNTVWNRFLLRCKGTIWDIDPAGQHSTKYVRLLEVEQRHFVRRKLMFDSNGTNHANITAMGFVKPDAQPVRRRRTCPAGGGEEMLLACAKSEEEEEEEEKEEEQDDLEALPSETGTKPTVHFSIPCEVPYMMHCWSATLVIRADDLCIFFDDENKAYNQRIAEEAESLLIKPSSIIYPSAHVRMLAPGRRFRMRRSGVELWFHDGRSVLINFSSISDMRSAVRNIRVATERHKATYMSLCIFNENPKKDPLLWRRMEQWRDREISNFDYLLWLNFFSGRTLNDLTQYPVFPWVLSDYTSKELDLEKSSTFRDFTLPVGICGGSQFIERVKMRYEETKHIGDIPAHYFTHYSSSAVVLYYLIRLEPFTTLQIILQGGHFDHADRMFHSMAACWHGVTTNSQDVRELIPELFYMPEICMNTNGVKFGCKQGGEVMDLLQLPPWSHGDPYEFVYRMREALESNYVSSMLNHWIDLIFGYKQRGKEAIAALNVFNWYSYEDLDKNRLHSNMNNYNSGDASGQLLIDSLDNIGQTPIQLFTQPHGERRPYDVVDPLNFPLGIKTVYFQCICAHVARVVAFTTDRVLVVGGSGTALVFRLVAAPSAIRRAKRGSDVRSAHIPFPLNTSSSSAAAAAAGNTPAMNTTTMMTMTGAGNNNNNNNNSNTTTNITTNSNTSSGGRPNVDILEDFERRAAPLPAGVVPNMSNKIGGPCESENIAVLYFDNEVFLAFGGLFDNTVLIRPLDATSGFPEERLSAHYGRVVRITASADSHYIVSGSEDTTFIVWSCYLQQGRSKLFAKLLFTVYGHEDIPTAVDLCPTLDLLATASKDGVLMLHGLTGSRIERSLRHPEKHSIDRVLIQGMCYLPNILYASSVDNVIHQISINGVALRSMAAPGRITSWCITPRQYILVTTAPFTYSNASEESTGMLLFLHGFYLSVLKSVPCPLATIGSTLTCCSVHPLNPQVIVCGSSEGSLSLIRVEM